MMSFSEITKLRDVLARSLAAGSPAVVATLVSRDGHSYREAGSMMVMTEGLQIVGAVSGGCLEAYIGRAARRLLHGRQSVLLSFDTAEETPDRPTLGCGGRLQILVEKSLPQHLEYLEALLRAMRASDAAAAIIGFDENGASPDSARCRMVVSGGKVIWRGDPWSFAQEPNLSDQDEARVGEAIALREALTWRCDQGWQTACYLWPQPCLAIFGARDDAMPLVEIAKTASWHVTVVDRRDRLASRSRFSAADEVISAPWREALAAIPWTPWTSVVLMTHSLEDDIELLPPLLLLDLDYLGVLGPSARTDRLWEGLSPDQRRRVHSPIGAPLGEKSPAAVAVAIMAELIANRRGRIMPRAEQGPRPAHATRHGVPALILAAGASRRLGEPKGLLRDSAGKTLLSRAIATARQAGFEPLVTIRPGDATEHEAREQNAQVIEVLDASEGMSASIRAGIRALEGEAVPGVLVVLVDQFRLTPRDLTKLRSAWERGGKHVAAARYGGRLGVPALFGRDYFRMLGNLTGDRGARDFLRRGGEAITGVDLPRAEADVDTAADVEAARETASPKRTRRAAGRVAMLVRGERRSRRKT